MSKGIDYISEETNRLGLICTDWYLSALNNKPELIDSLQNGVGSECHWSYRFIPNTVWGLNIIPSSSIHDLLYCFPLEFPSVADGLGYKRKADFQFFLNVKKQIEDYGGWLKSWRISRLNKYMFALDCGGSEAFWANKKLPDDFFDYYAEKPEYSPNVFNRYQIIWREICEI